MSQSIYSNLNDAQKEAVNTIDGPVLVIAGPGTGKTQLLALRAAKILETTDVLPQNILCLTYTEAATRNMRDRLSRFIGKSAYDVKLSTYHGFGSDIIRAYPEYFANQKAETAIDELGQNQIMQEIYEDLPASNPLWRADIYLKDTLSFISEAKRALLAPDDLRTIAQDNLQTLKVISELSKKHLNGVIRIDKNAPPKFENFYVALKESERTVALPNNIMAVDTLLTGALAEAIVAYNKTGKTNSITKFKNDWLIKDETDRWIAKGVKEAHKILASADIYEQYLTKLATKNLFDFDDMILQAIDAIKKNDDLRFSLQEKYQYIMLDEFQDTNLAQLELIELLTNNPASGGQPNILAVGDDDQAIFSFQGADLTNMLRFFNMYKDVKTITLTENWRSHKDILKVSEFVSSQIEERLHHKLGFSEKLLITKNTNLPKVSNIRRHEFLSDLAELDWVAKEIAHLIKKGQSANNIAVIAPKHKYLEPLVPFLNNLGVPVRYDKRENIFEDPNILEIINSAKLILALKRSDFKSASALWPSVLSGPEWKIPTSEIWQLSWQSEANRHKPDTVTDWTSLMLKSDTFKPIALFYIKLSQIVDNETLENMLDYIIGVKSLELNEADQKSYTTSYFDYHFGLKSQQDNPIMFYQLLSNLTVLRQKLREFKQQDDQVLYLPDLIEFYQAYSNAEYKLLNTSPYSTSQDATQLLTAYSSKGLEFDVVFVLGALDDVWGMKAKGRSSNISLPENLKIIRRAGSSKDEKKRLFYVALTRAKHSLYLTSFKQNYAGKGTTYLEFLEETEDSGITISKALPEPNNKVISSDYEPPKLEVIQRFWQNSHIEYQQTIDAKELLRPRLENFQLSATHLNSFTDLVYGGPQNFFINTILRFPKAPSADGQYGNAIHETIDAIHHYLKNHQELPDIEDIYNIFKSKLSKKMLGPKDYTKLEGRGVEALNVFMPQWWPNFSPTNKSEQSFRDEGVLIGDAHLTGNLDHLLIDTDNKSIIVVDFKTGKGHNKWSKDIKMHKYRQQLLFYKILLQESHTFKTFAVDQGKLVFVEPDDDGKINELIIDYSQAELDNLKLLIRAVWQRIMNLDFPDTAEFGNDYKAVLKFEEWLMSSL